jgi:LL-diaminopimelate aminotransferase
LGLRARQTQAGLYVWAAVPEGFKARDFASWLFDQAGVLLTPGSNFGAAGEGYLRISMTAPEERIETALQRMKAALRELPHP